MAWTHTEIATLVEGNGVIDMGAEYDAVRVELTNVPANLGHWGAPGRIVYWNLGQLALGRTGDTGYPPVRLVTDQQMFLPPRFTVTRIFHYFTAGVIATLYGSVWS